MIDDCSPDHSCESVVMGFNDKRFHYLRNLSNLGLAGNWNACLDVAKTDLVSIVHADDELSPNYIETMIRAAEVWPDAVAFFCQSEIMNEEGKSVISFPDIFKQLLLPARKKVFQLRGEQSLVQLLRGNFIMCPTLCFRRPAVDGLRFKTHLRMVLDLEFTTSLILRGDSLVGLPDKAYRYRRHKNNQSLLLTRNIVRFQEETSLYAELERKTASIGWRNASKVSGRMGIIKLQLIYYAIKDLINFRLSASWGKICFLGSICVPPPHFAAVKRLFQIRRNIR